ncbi:MAG TPA: helix-turn-helix domain-containing protein [Mycobacteriales bacterium]|nr:helix-turn-helix domain-containing protein [Mycobacteriales bacterium]
MSVGETLTRARQERGLSVEDVTNATRIRSGLIRAIENDEFGPCGGAVYARGHIRNIARVLEVDPVPLVEEFDRAHADEAPPAPALVPAATVDPEVAHAEPKRANWAAAMVVALVAIIVLAAVSLVSGHGSSSPRQTASDHRPTPAPSSAPATTPGTPPPSDAVAQLSGATALVRVVSDRTWLQVWTLDGHELFQGILTKGASKVFRNKHGLRLLIGNAPAVDLVANGRDLGAPRAQGVVAHVTIQRDDVQFA